MNRRGFLKQLGIGAAAVATGAVALDDPEKLLWTPGKKTHFVAPVEGWPVTAEYWWKNIPPMNSDDKGFSFDHAKLAEQYRTGMSEKAGFNWYYDHDFDKMLTPELRRLQAQRNKLVSMHHEAVMLPWYIDMSPHVVDRAIRAGLR